MEPLVNTQCWSYFERAFTHDAPITLQKQRSIHLDADQDKVACLKRLTASWEQTKCPRNPRARLRLRLLMAPVPPPSILTHTHLIYLIGPCGAPAQSKRVKNSGGVVEKCVCVGGGSALTWVRVSRDPFKRQRGCVYI